MPIEQFSFQGHGGHKLAARLDMPNGPHLATAIFAHCFTCSKDIAAARRIAGRLAGMGIAVLRFDFTGLGHSEGEFSNTHFSSNVADIISAASTLTQKGLEPTLLIGHSLGGAAVIKASESLPDVKAVVTIGAPFDPGHVADNFAGSLSEIKEKGSAVVSLAGRPFEIKQSFVDDIQAASLKPILENLHKALLVLHAPLDDTVDISNAADIFVAAKHPKSFVTLDDADHLLTQTKDAEYAADVISAWVGKYLDLREPAAPIAAPEGVVRVTEADPKGFLQDINNGPFHHILADEPVAYGGTNKGMSPYGLVASGLGACTAMTIRMYARRKGWPLESVSVDVTHDKVHAQDAGTGNKTRIDTFVRSISLVGKLDSGQQERLLEIADKCPVHRTLEGSSQIETRLAG